MPLARLKLTSSCALAAACRDNCFKPRHAVANGTGYSLSPCSFDSGSSAYLYPDLEDWGPTFNDTSYAAMFPRTALQYSWKVTLEDVSSHTCPRAHCPRCLHASLLGEPAAVRSADTLHW
jgi:hypothetical protein